MVEKINELNYAIDYYNSEKDEKLKSVLNLIKQIFEDKYNDNLILNENIINNNKIYDIPLMFINKKKINNKSCFLYLIEKYINSSKNNEKTLLYLLKLFYNNLNFKSKNYHEFYQFLSKKLYYESNKEIEQNIINKILNVIKIIYNIDEEINKENLCKKNFFFIQENNGIKIKLNKSIINITEEKKKKKDEKKVILLEISIAFKLNENILKKNKKISIIKFEGIFNGQYEIYLIDNFIKFNGNNLIELNDEELKNIIQLNIFLSNSKKISNNFVIINSNLSCINEILEFNNIELEILSDNFLGKLYYIFGIYDKLFEIEKNTIMSNFFKLKAQNNLDNFINIFKEYFIEFKDSLFLFKPDKIYKNKITKNINNDNNLLITDYFNNIQATLSSNIIIILYKIMDNHIDNVGGFIVFIPLINYILSNNKLMNNSNNIILLLNYINKIKQNFNKSLTYETYIENLVILYQKYYENIKINLEMNKAFYNICFNKPYIKYLFEIKLLLNNKLLEKNENNKQKNLIILYMFFCELQKKIEINNINGIRKNLSYILKILNNDEENIQIDNLTDINILEILYKNIFLHEKNIFIKYWFYYSFFYFFLIKYFNDFEIGKNIINKEQIINGNKYNLDIDFSLLTTLVNFSSKFDFDNLCDDYQYILFYLLKKFLYKNDKEKYDIIENLNNYNENIIKQIKKENNNKKSFILFLFIPIPNDENKILFNYLINQYFEKNYNKSFMFLINILNNINDNELMFKDYILHFIIEKIEKQNKEINLYSSQFCFFGNEKNNNIDEIEKKELNSIKTKINYQKKYDIPYDKMFSDNIIKECLLNNTINQKNYKKLINRLFLNNGYWDYNIENENIKYKILNFITNDFKKPLLTKIIDLDYYFPKFTNYKGKETYKNEPSLFQHNYQKIYDLTFEEYDFEFLNIIDLTNEDIIKYFIIKNEIKKSFKNCFCCLIKQLYHIPGFVLYNENKLIFHSFINNEKFKDKKYCLNYSDNIKCYGQVFCCPKYQENQHLEILIDDIFYVFLRNYYYEETGIEIITFKGKNYYFNFNNEIYRNEIIKIFSKNEKFFKIILKKKNNNNNDNINNCLAFIYSVNIEFKKHELTVSKFISLLKNKFYISNYKIIMLINLLSNRTFLDLYQYPIFPWLIYNEQIENKNKYILKQRDLNILMAQMILGNDEKRIRMFKDSYELMLTELKENNYKLEDNIFKKDKIDEINKCIKNEYIEPYHISRVYYFNTHYSNIVYTNGYLIRIFPFSFGCIELQGDYFDIFNRLFHSIQKSFENSCIQKSDIREILPEFFYLPEMFLNINKLKFNDKDENLFEFPKIDDPIEFFKNYHNCNNIKKNSNNQMSKQFEIKDIKNIQNFINYIILFNMFLENDKIISENLQKWISLVFGENQKPTDKKIMNLFNPESYLDNPFNSKKYFDPLYYNLFLKRVEFGIIPRQIFFENLKGEFFNNYENNIFNLFEYGNEKENEKIDVEEIILYLNIIDTNIEKIIMKNEKLYYCYNDSVLFKLSKGKIFIDFKYNNLIIQSNKYNYIFVAYYELICIYNKSIYKFEENFFENQITSLELIEKKKNFLLCGDKKGNLLIFKIYISNLKKTEINYLDDFLLLYKKINNSFKEINFIKYNDELNLFLVLSKDNYINLYVPYTFKLLKNFQIQRENYLKFAFLYSFPIPSILIYDGIYLFFVSINGERFLKNNEILIDINLPFYYKYFNSYYLLFICNNEIKALNLNSYKIKNVFDKNNEIIYFNLIKNNIISLNKDKIFKYKSKNFIYN